MTLVFPQERHFFNNVSCKPFVKFIQQTLLDRLKTGAVSLLGKVGEVQPPHLVLPLTVEPTKPRLCHDARFLNIWMQDKPFKLDRVGDLPRYVSRARTKVFLMTNLVMIIFFWLMTGEHFLASSGVGGISPTIRYLLAGRFHRTFTITLALLQQISFGL